MANDPSSDQLKLRCQIHPQQYAQSLSFDDNFNNNRLLCTKCLINIMNSKQQILTKLVSLQDFLDGPGISIIELFQPYKILQSQQQDLQQQIENILTNMEERIKNQFIMIKQNIFEWRSIVNKMNEDIMVKLKLSEIVMQFQVISRDDSLQQTNLLKQQLDFVGQNLITTYNYVSTQASDNWTLISQNFKNNFKLISNEIQNNLILSLCILDDFNIMGIPQNIYDDIKEFPLIHQKISEEQQLQYELIYHYKDRDSTANPNIYWQKRMNQSHLLTIMTSHNGQKFGSYSPCKIIKPQNYFIQDPTKKTFLFQYNKKEIYNIRDSDKAIFYRQDYGPSYGDGCDIYVHGDFKTGHSHNLGTSYDINDINDYNILDKSTHIFSSKKPNLQELKVYKAIFNNFKYEIIY